MHSSSCQIFINSTDDDDDKERRSFFLSSRMINKKWRKKLKILICREMIEFQDENWKTENFMPRQWSLRVLISFAQVHIFHHARCCLISQSLKKIFFNSFSWVLKRLFSLVLALFVVLCCVFDAHKRRKILKYSRLFANLLRYLANTDGSQDFWFSPHYSTVLISKLNLSFTKSLSNRIFCFIVACLKIHKI